MKYQYNISAGLIIIFKNKYLLVSQKNRIESNHLSFPKGLVKVGEDCISAAIRETYEETGLMFKESDIDSTKEYVIRIYRNYNLVKKIVLFKVDTTSIIIPNMFDKLIIDKDEIEDVKLYTIHDALKYLNPSMRHLLFELKNNYK